MLNRQREKTSEQIAREAEVLMGVERERAKERQGKRVDLLEDNIMQHVAGQVPERGTSRDIVGEKLGVSGETIRRSIKVVEKIDELTSEGETEKALELRITLNTSVSKAHQEVKVMDDDELKGVPVVDINQSFQSVKAAVKAMDDDELKGVPVVDINQSFEIRVAAEKEVWDYTQKHSMVVRWKKFVGPVLQMAKVQESIIRDFNHDDFMVKLSTMDRTQLEAVYGIMMKSVDWLINIIRDMEDVDNG
jgi:hypothetical protein